MKQRTGKRNGFGMAALLAAALVAAPALCTACSGSSAAGSGLVVTEVMTSNRITLQIAGLDSPDWIELYNGTGKDLSLRGYSLTDNSENPRKYAFDDIELPAGEYLLVYAARSGALEADAPCAGFGLSKDGEKLYLCDPAYETVQELRIPALDTDVSYARRADGSYGYCALPTPGKANVDANITDDAAVAGAAACGVGVLVPMTEDDPVRISELLVRNGVSATDEDGDRSEWAELYNASAETVSLKGYYLSDRAADPYKWALPAVKIAPGGYLLIFLSGKDRTAGELHASFRLSDEDDGVLTLTDRANGRIDTLTYPKDVPENVAVGRDAAGEIVYYGLPTPGYENAKGFSAADTVSCFDTDGVSVSEVAATVVREKKRVKTDGEWAQCEWVELYNGGATDASLDGWTLASAKERAEGGRLPLSGAVEAGDYAVFSMADAGWTLAGGGDTLLLYDAEGRLCDIFATGAQQTGGSSGRTAGARRFYTEPTPGAANGEGYVAYTATPAFSETGLYHTDAFELAITCRTAGAAIRYTLDGSTPTAESERYDGPIRVEKNTVVRAAAFADGLLCGGTATATFLFTGTHTVPVYCITGEPDELQTILKKSALSRRPEYRTEIGVYTADGALGTSFACDTRIKGNRSSSTDYSQKSLVCHLRGDYGQDTLHYPMFEDGVMDGVTAFTLRNSGQDRASTRLRDAYCSQMAIAAGLNVVAARTRPVVVYCNAQYWGLYYLTEQLNEEYFAAKRGVDPAQIDIVDHIQGVLTGSNEGYQEARRTAISGKLSDDVAFAKFTAMVDADGMADYIFAKTYLTDYDPYNNRYWRAGPEDTWHPVYFDNDRACKYRRKKDIANVLQTYFSVGNNSTAGHAFNCGLKKNAVWRERFVERYVELAVTAYSEDRLMALLDRMTAELEPEMARHIRRWGLPESMEEWYAALGSFRQQLQSRRTVVLGQLQQEFGVSDARLAELIAKYAQAESP